MLFLVSLSEIVQPGDTKKGADAVRLALAGKKGALQDMIALNAGAGIYISGSLFPL